MVIHMRFGIYQYLSQCHYPHVVYTFFLAFFLSEAPRRVVLVTATFDLLAVVEGTPLLIFLVGSVTAAGTALFSVHIVLQVSVLPAITATNS